MPNYKSQSLLTGGVIASTTAPVAHVGQRWFNTATAVTYQYTIDAAGTTFWLDISSGGIGTTADRGVDFVGDTDPLATTNGSGLAVGSVYYNRENNRHFVCTDASNNANVWSGRFTATGGTVTSYVDSGTTYRVHTFLTSGTFTTTAAFNVDYLVVAGGGAGGGDLAAGGTNTGGGGGGAGGFLTASGFAVTAQAYEITVGAGGVGSSTVSGNVRPGGNSVFSSLIAFGGGGGGAQSATAAFADGGDGGSGGGSAPKSGNPQTIGSALASGAQGSNGGNSVYTAPAYGGGGGGGASAVGVTGTSSAGGNGGAGTANSYRTGSAVTYAGGGGGGTYTAGTLGLGGAGGGGNAARGGTSGAGTVNSGSGGGANGGIAAATAGGSGGSGIVVIRYAV